MLMGKSLRSRLVLLLACLPCCLPLLGISSATMLAVVSGALVLKGIWIGAALAVIALVLFLGVRQRLRRRLAAQPLQFFDTCPRPSL